MLYAAAPGAGAAAGDASAVRHDGAHRIIAFALETWNHNTLALALLDAATTPEELFHICDWKADLAEVLVLAGWRDARRRDHAQDCRQSVAVCRGGVAAVSRPSRWCHFLSYRRRLPRNWSDGGANVGGRVGGAGIAEVWAQ